MAMGDGIARAKQAEFVQALRARGVRCTSQRLAVLTVLAEAGHHLSVAEVHARVTIQQPGVGLATVYRALELLVDLGLATRIHLMDGCHRYAAASRGHRHQAVCNRCGRVIEIGPCALTSIADDVARRYHFVIESHWLQFFGHCETCQHRPPAASRRARSAGEHS